MSRHHDWIFSAVESSIVTNIKISYCSRRRRRVARRRTERAGTFVRDFPPVAAGPVTESLVDDVVALTDNVVALTDRYMGIGGLARIYRMVDDDRLPDGVVKRGVSSFIVRYGAGGQFRF